MLFCWATRTSPAALRERGKPHVVPKLAESEPDRRHEEDRNVGAAPVREQSEEQLRQDEHQEDHDDETWRDQLQQLRWAFG